MAKVVGRQQRAITQKGVRLRFVNGAAGVRRDEDVIDIVIVAAGIWAGERQVLRAVNRRATAMTNENRLAHAFSGTAAPLTSAIIASHAGTNSSSPSR